MENMNKKIIWYPWVDPLGTNLDDFAVSDEFKMIDEGAQILDPNIGKSKEDEEDVGGVAFDDGYDDNPFKKQAQLMQHQFEQNRAQTPVPLHISGMGIVPMSEHTKASDRFNFWVGHTNFDLTPNIARVISSTPGVETLDIWTRYRFRVSVGRAFDSQEVKKAIVDVVCGESPNYDLSEEVSEKISNELNNLDDNECAVIYVAPNENMKVVKAKDDKELADILAIFEQMTELFGGAVVTSWD